MYEPPNPHSGPIRPYPASADDQLHFRNSPSQGLALNFDLTEQLRLRLDLRGIYTALNSGGSVFCSGGCELRFRSDGYLQVEAGAGLVMRF